MTFSLMGFHIKFEINIKQRNKAYIFVTNVHGKQKRNKIIAFQDVSGVEHIILKNLSRTKSTSFKECKHEHKTDNNLLYLMYITTRFPQ